MIERPQRFRPPPPRAICAGAPARHDALYQSRSGALYGRAPPSILSRSLPIVTGPAQRLVIVQIPEQILITLMRHLVINNSGGDDSAITLAVDTERMFPKVLEPVALPSSVVSTTCCRSSTLIDLYLLLTLVLVTAS
jgi:hypothetical protein